MFKNLSTGTKLFILCGVFFVAIAIPIYSLIIEKKTSIDFTRKELVGSRYLAVLRGTYAAILSTELSSSDSPEIPETSFDEVLTRLGAAETAAGGITQTADLERSLLATLHELWFARDARTPIDTFVVAALTTARDLTARIADDSNLAIDPNLESYYLQDVVVRKLPAVMDEIGEAQLILRETAASGALSSEHKERLLMLDGLLRSTVLEMRRDLAAAYRADADGSLKRTLDSYITETTRLTGLYLNAMSVRLLAGTATNIDSGYFAKLYKSAVQSGLNTWTAAHAELDRNLDHRVADLLADMRGTLLLTGLLALASILVAIIVHRGIVPPLKELARLAGEISETKNYDLHVKAVGTDEIGQLGRSFNDMLSGLATARHRESAAQLELARVARLTAAGAMSASIAHEIKQPLAAVVANGSAGLRWLRKVPPDLSEVEEVLKQIVSEGNRASEVIGSVQSMFKGDDQARVPINVCVQPVSATPLVVYRLAFGSPRSFADVD